MFSENLDAFLDVDEHADHFVIQKSGRVFRGIIDKEYVETLEVASYEPVISCKSADVVNLERGDIVEHGSTLYKFIYEQQDGTGMSEIIMNHFKG